MNDFKPFALALRQHFAAMSQHELYRVDIDGDTMWQTYLAEFPEGSNPMFRVRTEHDGSYDRAFVRKLGNVVRLNSDGTLTSIWDLSDLAHPYNVVADALASLVHSAPIAGLFRSNENKLGVVSNIENREGKTHEWHHFHADVATRHHTREVDTVLGNANTTMMVLRRGLEEIPVSVVDDVLDLITEGNLYRGDEFKPALLDFRALQQGYSLCTGEQSKAVFLWRNWQSPSARVRNTAIGTLLQDLADGQDLERAVKSFEQKVAPTNYKRPTALITASMVTAATDTIRELGLESALERRFATIGDLSVNNVLWVDGQVAPQMKDGLTDLLMTEVKPAKPGMAKAVTQIDIDTFMRDVLPTARGMELFLANPLQSHLMSLTAPAQPDAAPLFKWGNNFGWSYNGNITDSIKEKVKAAGGNTNAVLRVSLAWFNFDDLDLHAQCPDGHVSFLSKMGILDVDMNAGSGKTRVPVENLSWVAPKDGRYTIRVNQYARRETSNVGFTLEVENHGQVTQYSYHQAVAGTIAALELTVRGEKIIGLTVLNDKIVGQGISQTKWGVPTEAFVPVTTVLNSPNHWDGERTGNKHWFFMLAGCQNDEPTRGIYNEFLKPELETHRKVFEVLGNKTKCLPTAQQLSGIGFSSTQRDAVTVKVTDASSNRLYEINF